MISLEQARRAVLDPCELLPVVEVTTEQASGLATAEALTATELVPPFDNSAMDGFAVRAADTVAPPNVLDVVDTIAAGSEPAVPVGPGQAARIMTGAPLPAGADAVVMVELTGSLDEGKRVEVREEVPIGNSIRRAGEDLSPGDPVFGPRTTLSPGHIGVLCTLGVQTVRVHRRARVGVMSTGDELVDGAGSLRPGQIRDSNRRTLLTMLHEAGCDTVDVGLVPDDEAAIERALLSGVGSCDALISSGGVSMGDFDYVKAVLDRLGDMRWMQVAIKPAKPLAFGRIDDVPVFGLPGNPVSSVVSFELFARPALRKMMGHRSLDRVRLRAIADADLKRRPDGKIHFARVRCRAAEDGVLRASFAGPQGSHQLSVMAAANALAVLPDGPGVAAGDPVQVILLAGPEV
ncbi:MAG: Molybdopterin molybdenumtransferase [Acidimicrobiales bacterium]|nr:MAG: molybdopterin molybdenumtransferase MoeA [Actinomycetota bacterium]MBV6509092.1 Molybdopterin molybdenumtransferase [Acidimicrobiales bacterium]RIK03712.1 MAG: hypothetical protein DCC48_15830 [Acidobacteriota bacterium]